MRISHRCQAEVFVPDYRRAPEHAFPAALDLATAATRGGTTVRLIVGEGMQHDWPLTLPWLDESRSAWTK